MENNNSVCYVGRVTEVKAIEGADNIELGVIGGWNAIIQKGQYKVDELVVVATTDAVIPVELSDAINVTSYLRKGGRVRTVKLRGVYSECLIIPFSVANSITKAASKTMTVKVWNEGDDLMEVMNIFKYEPPSVQVQLASGRKFKYHQNPNFGVYYKFPNLKNVAGMFTEDDSVEITRKLHGTNARYGIVKKKKISIWDKVKRFFGNEWVEYEYVYGSHNVEKGSDSQGFYSTDVWRTIAEKYKIKEQLWELVRDQKQSEIGSGIILYGEIYGAGIQKNYEYGLKDMEFVGFDLVVNGKYEPVTWSRLAIENCLQLPYVEILYQGEWSQEIQDSFVFNNFIKGTKVPHEGIVIKHVNGERNKVAKVINPDYLIYGEKHNVGDSH
jgi:RNA ligase (TIGR02306 family)